MNDYDIRGIKFPGVLTIVFIILKLCGVISWSWFWVISPILFEIAVIILVCTVLYVMDRRR